MKKTVLKIIIAVIAVIFIYFGWKVFSFGNSLKNFGQSVSKKLTSMPIVKQEIYSPDSLQKIGVYRFLQAGEGSFVASPFEVSLIDTSMDYPRSGNILTGKKTEPQVKWLSIDSVLIKSDSTLQGEPNSVKKLNKTTILIRE